MGRTAPSQISRQSSTREQSENATYFSFRRQRRYALNILKQNRCKMSIEQKPISPDEQKPVRNQNSVRRTAQECGPRSQARQTNRTLFSGVCRFKPEGLSASTLGYLPNRREHRDSAVSFAQEAPCERFKKLGLV